MASKSQIAVILSRLKQFENPDPTKEQYPTDSEIAAEVLWNAFMSDEIEGRIIADLGCGTGFLGIGALLLGAKKVYFVEKDKKVIKILKENLSDFDFGNYEIINKDVIDFNEKVDVVLQNPPFGIQKEHADKVFLEKAFLIAEIVYSFHKIESEDFIRKLSEAYGFEIKNRFIFDFPLKKTMDFHRKKLEKIKVGCWKFVKNPS